MKRSIKNSFSSPALQRRAVNLSIGLVRMAFIIGLCYLFLFPVLYMLITAFQDISSINDPTVVWIPTKLSLEGITKAIKHLNYWDSVKLTLVITVFSTVATVISCSLAGYGLARFKFPGRGIAFAIVILIIIIPPQVIYSSTYLLYRFFDFGGILSIMGLSFNLLEQPTVFILPAMFGAGLRSGIFIFIFYSFFKGQPIELEEAAKIDGCGVFRTFVRVMVPLAVPAFVTVLLFSIVWYWTDYYSSSTFFTQQVRPIVVMLKQLELAFADASSSELRIYLQAGALLTIAPPLILYLFAQKYFTESIERTGLVG